MRSNWRGALLDIATQEALKKLGLNETYHMESTVVNALECELWMDALAAKYDGGKPFRRK